MASILRSVTGLVPALVSAGICLDRGIGARRRGRAGRSVAWYSAGPFLAYAAGVAPIAVAASAVLVVGGRRLYAFAVAEDEEPTVHGGLPGWWPGDVADAGGWGGPTPDDERPDR
jgi:hypothetical protein